MEIEQSEKSLNSEAVKELYAEKYKAMVGKLSSSVFLPLKDILTNENMSFDENEVLKRFTQDTLQDLISGLEFAWEKSDIQHNLDHLEKIKAKNEKFQGKFNLIEEENLGLDIKMKYLILKQRRLENLLQIDEELIKNTKKGVTKYLLETSPGNPEAVFYTYKREEG
ncbi:hypothetical protein ACFFRR_007501 [Megaselia abdita]